MFTKIFLHISNRVRSIKSWDSVSKLQLVVVLSIEQTLVTEELKLYCLGLGVSTLSLVYFIYVFFAVTLTKLT